MFWSSLSVKLITDCLKSFEFLWAFKKPSSLAMKSRNRFDFLRTFYSAWAFEIESKPAPALASKSKHWWDEVKILASKVFLS